MVDGTPRPDLPKLTTRPLGQLDSKPENTSFYTPVIGLWDSLWDRQPRMQTTLWTSVGLAVGVEIPTFLVNTIANELSS